MKTFEDECASGRLNFFFHDQFVDREFAYAELLDPALTNGDAPDGEGADRESANRRGSDGEAHGGGSQEGGRFSRSSRKSHLQNLALGRKSARSLLNSAGFSSITKWPVPGT